MVSKFRHIHKNWNLLKQMQVEAKAAVRARDNYQTQMRYAKNAEETAADYLKRARDVLRR